MTILVKIPFNLSSLDFNRANIVFKYFPDIKNLYIGGHTYGG